MLCDTKNIGNEKLISLWREYFRLARLRNAAMWNGDTVAWVRANFDADHALEKVKAEIQILYPGEDLDF